MTTFTCCEQDFESGAAVKAHLQDKHGITEFKGTQRMLMHLDCRDEHHTQYEITIGSVVLTKYVVVQRKAQFPSGLVLKAKKR